MRIFFFKCQSREPQKPRKVRPTLLFIRDEDDGYVVARSILSLSSGARGFDLTLDEFLATFTLLISRTLIKSTSFPHAQNYYPIKNFSNF